MKKTFLTFGFAMIVPVIFAQQKTDLKSERPEIILSLNLLGDASIISANIERAFLVSNSFILTSKLGLGFNQEFQICIFGPCSPPESYFTIPHHFTGNFGHGKHFLEFGLGGSIICGNTNKHYYLYPIVGYRLLPLESNKISFRIFGEKPFSGLYPEDIIFMPFGISLGIGF